MDYQILSVLACLLTGPILPGQDFDLNKIEKQLVQIIERPSGQPISVEQKEALGKFLEIYDGKLGTSHTREACMAT